MSPEALLAAARALLSRPELDLGHARPRAVALLARQALEGAVEAEVTRRYGEVNAPFTVQLLCYQQVVAGGLGERAAATWSGLSEACHVVGYEIPPAPAVLDAWLLEVERVVRG